MDTESFHLCPECGKPVPAESPHQLCPACLMAQALASRTLVDGDDADAVPPPLSPEEIAEKFPQFEITECLGRGGMGSVYKARQKSLNRWVAIKILAPEREGRERFAERFAREAQTLARLSHPHIVTIHDFGQTDGLFYLVMEYVDGVNLRELLRDGKIEPAQALTIVPPICDALQYAHDKGVVHRDIKPENLLLDRDGRVKIADFGIASLIGAENESAGTPAYMAPEQADAKREVDHRADIYALGVVLYEMLTGERPAKEVIEPSRKVQIDVRLDEIVLRALEKKPELRFQDATLFKTQVEAIAEADEPCAETGKEYDAPSVPARAPLKRKLFRFVQAFASAFGTIWLILILAEIVARPHFTFGNPVVYGLLVISGVYGAWRSRPSAQPLSRAGQFFEGFSSAFGTVFLVGCAIVLFTASKFSIHGYELAGLSAASLIYAFWQDRRAYASSSAESSKDRRAVVLVKGVLVLVTVGLAVGYFIESSRSHVPKDVHTPQTERTLAASPPTPPDTTPASPSFGPVIEREIPPAEDDAHGLTFFSLARGEVVKPPFPVKFTTTVWMGGVPQNGFSFIEITPQLQEWAKARSVDLVFAFEPGSWHWQTLEARIRYGFSETGAMAETLRKEVTSKRSFDSISPGEAIDTFSRPPRFWNDPQKDGALDKAYVPHVASFWSYPEADKDVWPGAFNIYKTRTGQVGIMEIMTRPMGKGVKLRYKLVQEPGASPEAHEKEPARTPVAEERYSLKVQFGEGSDDPVLTTDVELGVAFSDMKEVGKRVLSIDGQIDPPTDGLYRGQLRYLDVDSTKNFSVQKSGCELALKPGIPFRFVTVNGIARFCIVTLTRKQPDGTSAPSETKADTSPIVPLIHLKESSLVEALGFLRTKWSMNYTFDPTVTEEWKNAPVLTARWKNLTARQILTELLDLRGLEWVENPQTGVARIFRKPDGSETKEHQWVPYGQGKPDSSPVIPIIDLKDSTLVEALDFLQTKWSMNYAFDPTVSEELKNAPVLTGRWEKLTALQAMTELLDLRGLQLVENPQTSVARVIHKPHVPPAPVFPEESQSWDPWAESIKKGEILRMNGNLPAALERYQNSLVAAEKTRAEDLRNQRLAESHMKIGDVLCAQNDLAGAMDHYRSSMTARERQAKKSPQDTDVQKQLVWTWVKLGDVQKAQGDLKGALTSYRGGPEGEAFHQRAFETSPSDYKRTEPFKPEELTQLAANPKGYGNFRRLMWLINRAGAEKNASFRFLLDKPDLRKRETDLALTGYDFSVNGNQKALDDLLSKLADEEVGSDSSVVVALSFIDEWDRSIKAVNAHFTATDGAGGMAEAAFWQTRAYLFPRQMLEFKGEAGEGAPLKATSPPGRSEPVILSIEPDGTLLLSGEPCPEEKLQERLTALGEKNPDTQVTLRASKLVPYSRVVSILETCQRANLRNISFTTH
jgi:predicted Ser/Thr protein kinase/tetratricopeptide (TPR) repeat protein